MPSVERFEQVRWSEAHASGAAPPALTGHVATLWRSALVVHGGQDSEGTFRDSSVWLYDINRRKWSSPVVSGHKPISRKHHAAAMAAERLFMLGGCGLSDFSLLHTMPVLDLRTSTWSRPSSYGRLPPAVAGHTLTSLGRQLVLLGGRTGQMSVLPDVHILDVDTMTWTRRSVAGGMHRDGSTDSGGGGVDTTTNVGEVIVASSASEVMSQLGPEELQWQLDLPDAGITSPSERLHHTAIALDGKVLVFGGAVIKEDGELPTNDLWLLDLGTDHLEWARPRTRGVVPPPLLGHATCQLTPTQVATFGGWGGWDSARALQSTVWLLDTDQWTWAEAPLARGSGLPEPRKGHTLIALGEASAGLLGGDDLGTIAKIANAQRRAAWQQGAPQLHVNFATQHVMIEDIDAGAEEPEPLRLSDDFDLLTLEEQLPEKYREPAR